MKFLEILKNLWLNLLNRLKPRKTFRWIFSAVFCTLILIYIGFGIYFGIEIYGKKNDSPIIKTSTYFYPFPAAFVNGKVVWASAYYQQLNYIQQFSSKTKQTFSDQTDLRKKIIDQLTEDQILQFQALRYNIKVSNKDFNDAYQQVIDQAGGRTEVKKVLNDLYGMSEREFKTLVRQKLIKEAIRNNLMVQVQVAHVFTKDENRAKDVAARAQKGEDFAGLAKQFSEDTKSRDNNGELGWLGKGQLVADGSSLPEFDNAVFGAKVGDIVGPVKTSAGFEVVKVEAKKGVINDSFDNWLANLKKQTRTWRFIK
ncbi:MAG: peptidylprolyl isomerase [Candidatus Berkelbacteria bacterium]